MTSPKTAEAPSLASSSTVLAGATFAASGANYLLNLVLGRWLDRAEFGDASLMVTAMLALTSIAVGLQLATVQAVVGRAGADRTAVLQRYRRFALAIGGAIGIALAAGSMWLSTVLNTASPLPFAVLGLGVPSYFVLAVDRGVLQGDYRFKALAGTYLVEAAVRLVAAFGLVAAGFGATGATWGLTLSFVASWLVARRSDDSAPAALIRASSSKGPHLAIGVLLLGQVIINNGDVVLSKWILDPAEAGSFAAVALIGRAVFFASWAVVQTAFPAVAAGDGDRTVALAAIKLVSGVSAACVVGIAATAPIISSLLFPSALDNGSMLLPYALATALFAIANVAATVDVANGQWHLAAVLLVGAVVQTAAIVAFGKSTHSIIMIQVIVMGALMLATGITARIVWYKGFATLPSALPRLRLASAS